MNDIATLSDNEWIINGKVYDLSHFIDIHPGGKTILNMNRKRDCTELFETYHLMSLRSGYRNSKLNSLFVRNATDKEIASPYDWNDDKYKEMKLKLKTRFHEYFATSPSTKSYKASNLYKLWYCVQFILLIIDLYYYFSGYWLAIIFQPLFAWLFCGDILHSGIHYAIFNNYYLNEFVVYLFGWYHCTFCVWYFQHNISHHSYTNMDNLDVDLIWHKPFYFNKEKETEKETEKGSKKRYRYWTMNTFKIRCFIVCMHTSIVPILSMFGIIYNPILDIIKLILLKKKFISFEIYITYLQSFILLIFVPFILMYNMGIFKGLLFYILPRYLHGIIYHIFSQISHVNKFSFQNNKLQKSNNFIVHQISSSCDYDINSLFIGFVSNGLNNQTLHHLIPTVHPCHYPYLSSILKEFCKEYNIKQSIHHSLYDAINDYFNHVIHVNIKYIKY